MAIKPHIPQITRAAECYVQCIESGGRIFYAGAGTSGRLGILDAAECPPTFSTDPGLIRGLIAGGPEAVFRSSEGAEDDLTGGARAVSEAGIRPGDVLVGLAASGRTPWVVGALRKGRELGAKIITIDCTPRSEISDLADIPISIHVGAEVIAGSTRMKAGTAQKLVLNMLSTTAMIRLGKVYGNLMVDLQPWSEKLRERGKAIVSKAAGVSKARAGELLDRSGGDVKVALVMAQTGKDPDEAKRLLEKARGLVRKAIELGLR